MSDKPGLLALYHFSPWFTEELKKRFDVFGPFPTREIAPHMVPDDFKPRVRAIATVGSIGEGGRAMLDALPNVSIIHCYGTGFERMDLKTAKERGIVITNAADSNASAVADIAVGLLLASTRRICEGDRYIRAGRWERRGAHLWPPILGLKGAKVGILGLGAIGVRIATRIAAFEAEIGYHSRTQKPDVPWAYLPSALALAEWCDFLIVALRSDASNKHIINMELLKKLGPMGHVVNISRGMAVDEAGLADA
ncbi:MAG: NAD(P)-dependent oxidoreductase, partial [Reyranellaceae bacterium]